jgi:hypothetical protein
VIRQSNSLVYLPRQHLMELGIESLTCSFVVGCRVRGREYETRATYVAQEQYLSHRAKSADTHIQCKVLRLAYVFERQDRHCCAAETRFVLQSLLRLPAYLAACLKLLNQN